MSFADIFTVADYALITALSTEKIVDVVTQLLLGANPNLHIPPGLEMWGSGGCIFGQMLRLMAQPHSTRPCDDKQKMCVLVSSMLYDTTTPMLRPNKQLEDLYALIRVGSVWRNSLGVEIINLHQDTIHLVGTHAKAQHDMLRRRFLKSLKVASAAAIPFETGRYILKSSLFPCNIKRMVCFKNAYRWPPEWDVGIYFHFD